MRLLLAAVSLPLLAWGESPLLPKSLGGGARLSSRLVHRARLLLREAKAAVSSDFEAALLKATRPDDFESKLKHVDAIVESVSDFEAYAGPDCDPFGLLIHKVWSRLVEQDARSVVKATYVLHRLVNDARPPTAHAQLVAAYRALGRQRSAKSGTLYHDHSAVVRLHAAPRVVGYDIARWNKFVSRYWTYVDALWRACALPSADECDYNPELYVSAFAHSLLRAAALAARDTAPTESPLARVAAKQALEDTKTLRRVFVVCAVLRWHRHEAPVP
ncbi:hypothetical protein M885DRAFT_551598 [Pelagophyceae sp. CCMP2097]|nr:hypothetical protein M885DRAFT_551598 [Pelagophyceae sp. CCMP2097]